MGSVGRRVCSLEELGRAEAASEFHEVLSRVSDLELGLFVMAQQGDDTSGAPEAAQAEAAVLASIEAAWPLVLKAIGYHEDMPEAEANRRMFEAIVEPIIYTRKTGVLRAFRRLELVGEGGESSRTSTNTGGTE